MAAQCSGPEMRSLSLVLVVLCWALPAGAHDFWLQPRSFWIAPGSVAPVSMLVGHGRDRAPWAVSVDRVLVLRSIGPRGSQEHRPALRGMRSAAEVALPFTAPGTHVLALQSGYAESNLPSQRFNAYAKEEGLTPALRLRRRTGKADTAGREIYSRRAKALVQVGPPGAPQPHVTRPIGLTLEIVPERDPYRLRGGESLPVRVIYEGKPLAGALVKLTNLAADERPVETHLTDRAGRAVFKAPRNGAWLLNVVWTKPIQGNRKADFDTTFSSLTFGYPPSTAR